MRTFVRDFCVSCSDVPVAFLGIVDVIVEYKILTRAESTIIFSSYSIKNNYSKLNSSSHLSCFSFVNSSVIRFRKEQIKHQITLNIASKTEPFFDGAN